MIVRIPPDRSGLILINPDHPDNPWSITKIIMTNHEDHDNLRSTLLCALVNPLRLQYPGISVIREIREK